MEIKQFTRYRFQCRCKIGFAGDGRMCAPDRDIDGWPDYALPCLDKRYLFSSFICPIFNRAVDKRVFSIDCLKTSWTFFYAIIIVQDANILRRSFFVSFKSWFIHNNVFHSFSELNVCKDIHESYRIFLINVIFSSIFYRIQKSSVH